MPSPINPINPINPDNVTGGVDVIGLLDHLPNGCPDCGAHIRIMPIGPPVTEPLNEEDSPPDATTLVQYGLAVCWGVSLSDEKAPTCGWWAKLSFRLQSVEAYVTKKERAAWEAEINKGA